MNFNSILQKALSGDFITYEEGVFIYKNAPTSILSFTANEIRKKFRTDNKVTWIIDRNVNITNICFSQCQFCNFCRKSTDEDTYITTLDEYKIKIKELFSLGGEQLLLQGGMHPKLGLDFYCDLFKNLKEIDSRLKLHALGPPEIVHIAKLEKKSYEFVLKKLIDAGLESLPGAGAEILVDRVRKIVSPAKCTRDEWLDVMREAHKLHMVTSATMMFGHVEKPEERIEHLIKIRNLQSKKPKGAVGFIAFIPWPFQDEGTVLKNKKGVSGTVTSEEYIRTIAVSRIILQNITNIQASWLTVGKETGQLCLHSGANDFGSIMIEENVVSAAGAKNSFNSEGIQKAIIEAGFLPQLRNQRYEYLPIPSNVIDFQTVIPSV